jgi:hypothetical protein
MVANHFLHFATERVVRGLGDRRRVISKLLLFTFVCDVVVGRASELRAL